MESFKVTAPTRVDLAGGTLDLWPLYCLTGGAKTINLALGMHAIVHVDVAPAPRFHMEVHSAGADPFTFSSPLELEEAKRLPPALQFPVAIISQYLSQQAHFPDKHVRLRIDSEAPLRSGLGGSSALCVAIARGMSRLFNQYNEQGWQWRLLQWVRDAEARFLATPTGTQDYLAALFGGLSCFTSEIGGMDRVAYPDSVYDELNDRMLVLFSGEMHHSGLSNWDLFKRAMEGDREIIDGLATIREVTDQLDDELRAGRLSWRHIGEHFNEEWRIRRNVFQVHTKRLDEIVQFLSAQNIYGAKVCGAAQGGSILAIVNPEQKGAVSRACEAHGIRVLHTCGTKSGVTIHSA